MWSGLQGGDGFMKSSYLAGDKVGVWVQLGAFFFYVVSASQTSHREVQVARGNAPRDSGRKMKALPNYFATLLTIVIKWLLIHSLFSIILLHCKDHRIRILFDFIPLCPKYLSQCLSHMIINIWWMKKMNEFNINVLIIVVEKYCISYWLFFEQGHFEIVWASC